MTDASQGPFFVPPIPTVGLPGGKELPALGIGTSSCSKILDPSSAKSAILDAIGLGYTHFQTEVSSFLEQPVGEAVAEALENGSVGSREEFFITSKIRFKDGTDSDSIVPNLKKSLETLKLESVDIFLVEYDKEDGEFSVTDFMLAWKEMEECQSLGLAKLIGVCNFSAKMLQSLFNSAVTIPSVNQVGMQEMWREKELREFCAANNITIVVSSAVDGEDKDFEYTQFLESEGFKIEQGSNVKKLAQVYFKWAYDQGAALLLESLDEKLIRDMLDIFK
ncbi:non-functional NADPH-dependent codeinone reductase 2-like [Henckelia pumila]|uniref:non-functional NADPH-dependent codeinone reductase 2-like n=1 Tax=Henckelia pumila TaxID=405737 RepID=UPI003C6DDD3D